MSTDLLINLEKALRNGDIDSDSVYNLLGSLESTSKDAQTQTKSIDKTSKLLQILYFIGGGIVFMGIAFWIGQQWDDMSSFMRISSTLGISIGFFISAVLLTKDEEYSTLSNVFFLISALLMPLGLGVTYDEYGTDLNSLLIATQIFTLLAVVFTAAYFLYKRNLLLFIAIIFFSVLFFLITDLLVKNTFSYSQTNFDSYRFLSIGFAWVLLGHGFRDSPRKPLTSWLYFFGTPTVLSVGLILSGWKPNQSVFWELFYPALALGFVFLSAHVKSRSFLIFGALGFGAYLCKITAEYFSDSLGWPLALILMGFLLIGIAFGTFKIRKKYW